MLLRKKEKSEANLKATTADGEYNEREQTHGSTHQLTGVQRSNTIYLSNHSIVYKFY